MLATGGLLVSIALLTLAAVAPVFRSSNPPRWTTRGWIGELVTLAIVCTLALGLGYLGAGAIDAVQTGPDYVDLALLVVVLFALVAVWRRLNARTGAKASQAEASAYAHAPESGQADSGGRVVLAEPLAVAASEPPRPPRAA
jgi:choline-glycine betaine transporter